MGKGPEPGEDVVEAWWLMCRVADLLLQKLCSVRRGLCWLFDDLTRGRRLRDAGELLSVADELHAKP